MDPRELFSKPLTYPRHEKGDIHYIGEALPAPSLAVSVLSQGTPAYTGGSAVPAREDHVHAIDLGDLLEALDAIGEIEIDFSNYYTITEIDAFFAGYYSITIIDGFLLDISNEFDDVYDAIAAVGGGGGPAVKKLRWSWPGLVSPSEDIYFPIQTVELPTGALLYEFKMTVRTPDATSNYIANLVVDGIVVSSITLTATSFTVSDLTFSDAVVDDDTIPIYVHLVGTGTGDAIDMTFEVLYEDT